MKRLPKKKLWTRVALCGVIAALAIGVRTTASSTVVVKPSTMNGWYFWNDKDDTFLGSPGELVAGPFTPPLGSGSVRLGPLTDSGATAAGHSVIATNAYAGTKLTDITALSYSTYQPGPTLAIALQFDVRYRMTDVAYGGRLVFEPYQNGAVSVGSGWQTWSPLSGIWWASKTTAAGSNGLCPQAAPCTWSAILAAFPDAVISGRFALKAGSNWNGFDGNADALTVGISGTDTTFDFEAEVGCTTDCYADANTGNDAFGGDSPASAKKTIQAAVTQVTSGGTVHVAPGTYSELVNVNKTITVQGAQFGVDGRNVGRTGLPATESVVNGNSGTTSFYVTASGVTIDGFTVQGETNVNQFGFGIVLGGGTHGSTVVNNIIQNNIVGLALANNSAVPAEQTVIQHNLFKDNNQPGPSSGTGIYTDQFVSGGTVQNVLIDANTFTGNGDAGVDFSSTDALKPQQQITISNNLFDGNARGMVAFNLVGSAITGNTFQNSTSSATADIRLFEGVSGLNITQNVLQNGAGRALRVTNGGTGSPDATSVTFNRNAITGYTGPATAVQVENPGYNGIANGTCNWWGASNGPSGAGSGSGSSVSANVDFSLWLITSNLAGGCTGSTAKPTVLSVNMVPSTGTTGTNVTVNSSATDPNGLTDIYYNLFTPGGTFVCNLAHVVVPGSPTSYTDSTPVASPMPFAGLDTGVGGPCPAAGIAEGSYVLTANWINGVGTQVGSPDNQNLSNYPAAAQFSPVIYAVVKTGTITVHKTVDAGSAPLTSFCFTLSPSTPNGQVCADSSGNAVFTNVPAGTYSASETAAPATYHQVSNTCSALKIVAQGDSPSCNVHDTINTGTITVHKTLDSGSAALTSFCFTLSPDPGKGQVCANASGNAVFTYVPAGTYAVTETASPATFHLVSNTCTGLSIASQGTTRNCDVHDALNPICETVPPSVAVSGTFAGPPAKVTFKVQDTGSGVQSISVIVTTNATTSVPAFVPGTTAAITVTSTKINQSAGSVIGLQVTDKCGNVTTFDPFDVTVNPGRREAVSVSDIADDESLVKIENDDLDAMRITVNGHEVVARNLGRHETRIIDVARFMIPGDDNTMTFEARGPKGSSAVVTVYPPPTGSANVIRTHRKHKRGSIVYLPD